MLLIFQGQSRLRGGKYIVVVLREAIVSLLVAGLSRISYSMKSN